MIKGKGFYIWQLTEIVELKHLKEGNTEEIEDAFNQFCEQLVAMDVTYILLKVADGTASYNSHYASGELTKANYIPRLRSKCRKFGIDVFGWQWLYLKNPVGEAVLANKLADVYDLDGWVINAEAPVKQQPATRMSEYLTSLDYFVPTGLSSYRYPSYHNNFPWYLFSDMDFYMPQVYWEGLQNSGTQLDKCYKEYRKMYGDEKQIIPTAPTYTTPNWAPTVESFLDFHDRAVELGMESVNYYRWGTCNKLWKEVIANEDRFSTIVYPPPTPPEQPDPDPIRTIYLEIPEIQVTVGDDTYISDEIVEVPLLRVIKGYFLTPPPTPTDAIGD